MKLTLNILFPLFCLFYTSFTGFSQLKTVHKVVNYEPKDYVAHNQNWKVVQKSNGVMYFANGDGVLEYDGTTWELYPTVTRTNVLSVGIDENERIYYSGVGEIGYLVPSKKGGFKCKEIEITAYENVNSADFFWDIHVFESCVIFRSESILVQYSDKVTNFLDVTDFKLKGSYSVGNDFFIFNTDKELYRFDPATNITTELVNSELVFENVGFVLENILEDSKGGVFMVSSNKGLYTGDLDNKTISKCKTQLDDLSSLNIDGAIILATGELVFSSINTGVYVLNNKGEIITHYNNQNGLKTNAIRSVFQDREGLLWFTSDVGISKALFNKPFSWMPNAFESVKGNANALVEFNNKLYIGTNEGVFIIDGLNELTVTQASELTVQAFDLAIVEKEVFAATTGGLFLLDNEKLKPVLNIYSRAILPLSSTYILVGGRKEIFQLQKINGNWLTVDSVAITDEILHLEQDPNNPNVVWGGLYSSGVAKIEIDTIKHSCSFVVHNPDFVGVEGYILPFQGKGRMMFAPKSSGIFNLNEQDDKFEFDKLIEQKFGEDISCWVIKEDIYNNLYIENSGPVSIIRDIDGQFVLDSISLTNLNIGYVNDIYCSEKGITWLVGEQGIVRFDPKEVKKVQREYFTMLNGVYINGDSVLLEGSYFDTDKSRQESVLNYGFNNISFSFASPQFSSEESLLYSFRLVGFDQSFSEWKLDRKAIYTNLNEGEYTFQVKSLNAEGIVSNIAEFKFEVLAPWYRSSLAYGLYILLSILVIFLIVRIYSFRLKKINRKLQKIVLEKTKVITANMEELGLQKEQLEEHNNDIIGSIHYAKQLQRAILPSHKVLQSNLKNYFVYYQPKDIVAGDFYWLSKSKSSNDLFLSVADCTGHGVPGAMVSVVCSNALNTAVREYKLKTPNEILDAVNIMVLDTFNADNIMNTEEAEFMVRDGMDLALCKLDLELKTITFSGANNPLWLFSKEDYDLDIFYTENGTHIYELKGNRQPIGGNSNPKKFTAKTINISTNDVVYMFTDGIVDQFGRWKEEDKIKKFKRINLAKSLMSMQHIPIEDQQAQLHLLFKNWKGNNEQIDDVTIMGVKI